MKEQIQTQREFQTAFKKSLKHCHPAKLAPFEDLFYFEIAKGMLAKSKEYGYNIVFTEVSVQGNSVILPQIMEFKDTDGVIFLQDTENAVLNRLDELEIPYVVVDAHGASEGVTTVNADYDLSSYGGEISVESRTRDIAFISQASYRNFICRFSTDTGGLLRRSRYPYPLTGYRRMRPMNNLPFGAWKKY